MKREHPISIEDLRLILPIVVFVATIIVWGIRLEYKVGASDDINKRQQEQIDGYPSSDWFEEKFKNTDRSIELLNEKVDDLTLLIIDQN